MTRHAEISYVKSATRMLGYLALALSIHSVFMTMSAALLLFAEVLGIVEEIGE
jgi:hypothetical protein